MRQGILSSEPELENRAAGQDQKLSIGSVSDRTSAPRNGSGLGNAKANRKGQPKYSIPSEQTADLGKTQIEDDDFFEHAGDSD